MTDDINLSFNGVSFTATPGKTVGGALADMGIHSWRATRIHGKPRGLFCGIGICHDCLITVNGIANQRACLVPITNGMQLESSQRNAQEVERDV